MYKNPTQTRQQLLQSANNSKRQYQSQQGNPNNINNKNQKINEQSQKTNKRNSNPNPNQSQELQGLNSKLNQKNTTSNPSQYAGKRLQSAQVNRTTDQKDQHQEAVFNIIHEYLAKKGLTKTLESFENEINNQSQLQTQELHDQQIKQEKLIEAFNSGNREQFFKVWAQIVPTNTRQNNDQCSKLEFYLNIYFFVYNIHPFCGTSKKPSQIPKQNVEQFKLYLENRGKDLSKTSEFLQYYALPYIDKPQNHTALKHIFTQEWVQEIQEKLAHFLKSFYPSEQQPLLYQMYQAFVKQNLKQDIDDVSLLNLEKLHLEQKKSFMDQSQLEQMQKSEIAQLKNDNQELMSLLQELNQKHQTLLQRYKEDKEQVKNSIFESQKKWVQVSQDLVIISKNLLNMIDLNQAQGVKFSENQLASYTKKILKFENTLSTNIEELISQSQDQSIFDKVSQTEIDNSVIPQQKMEQQPYKQEKEQFYTPLNFAKIKEVFLRAQEPILICAILQALKWRITKSRGAYVRREVVISYATFDILGCKNLGLQQELLMGDKKVQEFTLRLINSMASDYHGRSYLVESDELVKRLINILRIEHEDTPIRRNALGSLQKLSLRRRPQIVMIQNDLIQWIVDTLRDQKDTLSEYSYEYATALFMNLSLRSLGKNKCEDQHFMKDVLEVLNALLEHENTQVRTFVNGTLYSLLSRQIIREQAISMGFNDILNFLMENSDDRFTKQIQYIIDQLNRDSTDEEIQSDNEEDNDVDDIEDEEDLGEEEETDELINVDNILLGEELLINQYALQGQEAIDQSQLTKSIINDIIQQKNTSQILTASRINRFNNEIPFNRPQTPMSVSQISYIQQEQMKKQNHYQNQDDKFQRNPPSNQNQQMHQQQYQLFQQNNPQNVYDQQEIQNQYAYDNEDEYLNQQQQQQFELIQNQLNNQQQQHQKSLNDQNKVYQNQKQGHNVYQQIQYNSNNESQVNHMNQNQNLFQQQQQINQEDQYQQQLYQDEQYEELQGNSQQKRINQLIKQKEERQQRQKQLQQQQQQQQFNNNKPRNPEEYQEGFISQPKIPRTPPQQQQSNKQFQMQNKREQQYF